MTRTAPPTTAGTWAIDSRAAAQPWPWRDSSISVTIATRPTTCSDEPEHERRDQGIDAEEPVDRHDPAAEQRAQPDRGADHDVLAGQAALDVDGRISDEGGVDEPRLERPAVEGAEDALEAGVEARSDDRVGHQQQAQGTDRHQVRHDEHGLAAERIGETTARELEEQHHDALHRGADADLREREAAVAEQQHEHRDEQPRRREAEGQQQVEAPADRAEVGGAHTIRSGDGKACRSSGDALGVVGPRARHGAWRRRRGARP